MDSIELFSGTGGLALGLQSAGFNHKALFEWDTASCENIKANIDSGYKPIQHWSIYQEDVRDVSYSAYEGKIHLVAGGPPCQPFSLGGKHKAYNDKRDMFPEAVRAVRSIKPEAFVFENVKGLLRKSFASYFNYILLQLTYPDIVKSENMEWQEHLALLEKYHTSGEKSGLVYNVIPRLLNAADYGVPQTRHRVIIVGFRKDYNANWTFPQPTHSSDLLLYEKWITKTYWERHNMKMPDSCEISKYKLYLIEKKAKENEHNLIAWRTVRDAICDLPDPRDINKSNSFYNHEYRPGAKVYAGHTGSALDEPSKTIKAGAHGVPGGENTVCLDNGEVRYYTVRESARIQTFPDEYRFNASWTESMRQIGNAVPVLLGNVVGNSIYTQMKGMYANGKQK